MYDFSIPAFYWILRLYCDIRDVCGDYPAVYGFDIGHIELDHPCNLDSVDFILMNKLIREAPETVFGREWAAITH